MANKNKKNPHRLTAADIALAILAALGGAIAFMTIALVAGSLLFPESWERKTAEEPSARPSYHGTLPSKAPTSTPAPSHTEPLEEPSSEPTPEETEEPVQWTSAPTGSPSRAPQTQAPSAQTQAPVQTKAPAPTPAPTRAPTVPVQTPAPVVTVPPVQNTPSPAQSGNQNQSASTNQTGRTVYITPTGSKYHYDNSCNGGTYIPSTLEEALSLNLGPCRRCVLN